MTRRNAEGACQTHLSKGVNTASSQPRAPIRLLGHERERDLAAALPRNSKVEAADRSLMPNKRFKSRRFVAELLGVRDNFVSLVLRSRQVLFCLESYWGHHEFVLVLVQVRQAE